MCNLNLFHGSVQDMVHQLDGIAQHSALKNVINIGHVRKFVHFYPDCRNYSQPFLTYPYYNSVIILFFSYIYDICNKSKNRNINILNQSRIYVENGLIPRL